jgi:predicted metal-binding protein
VAEDRPCLHVCITCRAGEALAEGDTPQGMILHQALDRLAAGRLDLRPATCMANCERGCSAAISAPGKWTYVLAGLRPEMADDLLVYADAYAASSSGTVMPSRRPPSLRHAILARVPAP